LRLYQLTGLERESIEGEYNALIATIKDLLDILAKEQRVLAIITDELRRFRRNTAQLAARRLSRSRARSRWRTSSRTKASSSR
jgi:DNA gyrase/topoisomerase IV subunit A